MAPVTNGLTTEPLVVAEVIVTVAEAAVEAVVEAEVSVVVPYMLAYWQKRMTWPSAVGMAGSSGQLL